MSDPSLVVPAPPVELPPTSSVLSAAFPSPSRRRSPPFRRVPWPDAFSVPRDGCRFLPQLSRTVMHSSGMAATFASPSCFLACVRAPAEPLVGPGLVPPVIVGVPMPPIFGHAAVCAHSSVKVSWVTPLLFPHPRQVSLFRNVRTLHSLRALPPRPSAPSRCLPVVATLTTVHNFGPS